MMKYDWVKMVIWLGTSNQSFFISVYDIKLLDVGPSDCVNTVFTLKAFIRYSFCIYLLPLSLSLSTYLCVSFIIREPLQTGLKIIFRFKSISSDVCTISFQICARHCDRSRDGLRQG